MPHADDLDALDPAALLALSRATDPVGVLSIYVHADTGADPGLRGAAIDLGNRLGELQRRIAEEGPRERAEAVAGGIRRLQPEIEALTAPARRGRGRALFAALADGRVTRFASQLPLPNRVILDTGAFIHPLLELADEGRPAGVVLASQDEARVLEWRLGDIEELERLTPVVTEAPHERSGPVGSSPTARHGSPMSEQRAARERTRTGRFVRVVADAAGRAAAERGWDRVLVSGGERLTEALVAALPAPLRDRAVRDQRVLVRADAAELASVVTAELHAAHRAHEQRLLHEAREAPGALGLSEVAAALNEGRVAHLLYDPEVRYEGTVGADGALYAPGEAGPAAGTPAAEPRLTERLVERALDSGARVTPVEGAAGGGLADAGGIAALLRW